ncbi:MAG: aldose 1-epimerase [Parvibaculum sp.]
MQPSDKTLTSDLLHLTCKGLEAWIAPNIGGSLARFDANGQAMMRPASGVKTDDPLEMACYPLLPFIGRIAFGHFRFEGRDITLPAHPLTAPHALHGIGWQRPWQIEEHSAASTRLCLRHRVDETTDWPWDFDAHEQFMLDETTLTITLEIENRAKTAMPSGLGLHPFFEDRLDARLTGDLPYIWEASADVLPTNRTEVSAVRNFKQGRRIAPLTLDHCFSGGQGPLDITWEGRPQGLRIHRGNADHTAIYTPQAHDFFCVEPVTHVPNAVNRPEPTEITGLKTLAPGESMQLTCRLEVLSLK